jgi:hypothetical protein
MPNEQHLPCSDESNSEDESKTLKHLQIDEAKMRQVGVDE